MGSFSRIAAEVLSEFLDEKEEPKIAIKEPTKKMKKDLYVPVKQEVYFSLCWS